jgi:hypothetical protein
VTHRIVQEGPIFRRIRMGGHLGEPLAPAAVRDIVKERCALAGIEGRFSAHSLRAGFVTEAGKQNMPLPETMAMTGPWRRFAAARTDTSPTGQLGAGRMLSSPSNFGYPAEPSLSSRADDLISMRP